MVYQSGFRYLKTERDIAMELGIPVPAPIRVFDLDDVGVDRAQFLGDLAPTFRQLAWDAYDAKREQVAFLKRNFPEAVVRLREFRRRYYEGVTDLRELTDLFRRLDPDAKRRFERIRSYRRRSIARFEIVKADDVIWNNEWRVVRAKLTGFRQEVAPDDPRAIERIFDPTADDLVRHSEFQHFLTALAEMVEDAETDAGRRVHGMTATFHQMGLEAVGSVASTNAPEGTHQDGADYIVSALVMERDDVEGGTSVVYDPTRTQKLLEVTLAPGQGLFQADTHYALPSEQHLWHDVTPVRLCDTDGDGRGSRNIFGFDIVLHRPQRSV